MRVSGVVGVVSVVSVVRVVSVVSVVSDSMCTLLDCQEKQKNPSACPLRPGPKSFVV